MFGETSQPAASTTESDSVCTPLDAHMRTPRMHWAPGAEPRAITGLRHRHWPVEELPFTRLLAAGGHRKGQRRSDGGDQVRQRAMSHTIRVGQVKVIVNVVTETDDSALHDSRLAGGRFSTR